MPPRNLFLQFQESSRVVYLTGAQDLASLSMDDASIRSMRGWCEFDSAALVTAGVAHAPADSAGLARALDALAHPMATDPDRLATCRSAIEKTLAAKLQAVKTLLASGKRDEARKLLIKLDERFAGLAALQSLEPTGP